MVSLTNVLLFLILVTLTTYTFMPWKGIGKETGLKLYGPWLVWAIIFGIVLVLLKFFSLIN